MQIQLEGKVFRAMAKGFGSLLTQKVSNNLLDGVLLETKGSSVIATASNGTDWIAQRIEDVAIIEEGACVVPRDFIKTLAALKGEINLQESDNKLCATQGKSKFMAMTTAADEFPRMAQTQPLYQLKYQGSQWRDIVSYTAYAASTSESRPVLQGVRFAINKTEQQFVATDSARLSKLVVPGSNDVEAEVTIPSQSLKATLNIFDLEKPIILVGFTNHIAVMNNNIIYSIRALDGGYPETSRLIPTEHKTKVVVAKKELIESVKLLQTLSPEKNIVCTVKSTNEFELKTRSETKQGLMVLASEQMEGEEVALCCNGAFLLEALQEYKSDYVRFEFDSAAKPFLIFGEDAADANVLALILPIRTRQ